jgi:hypothetical protein
MEGYLLSKKSKLASMGHEERWSVISNKAKPQNIFGPSYIHMCPSLSVWQQQFSSKAQSALKQLGSQAIYVDQFGYGFQYICHNKTHSHPQPSNQLQEEMHFMKNLRAKIGPEKVIYSEYPPTDVSRQYQDGSFTPYNSLIDIPRFAFPNFKTFVMVEVDKPIGDNPDAIKKVFFNGKGLWIEGPVDDPKWFPLSITQLIKKFYKIQAEYKEVFSSSDVTPLVKTQNPKIHANKFTYKNTTIWTLYNTSEQAYEGEVLKLNTRSGDEFTNALDPENLATKQHNGMTLINLKIPAKGVGCIIRKHD